MRRIALLSLLIMGCQTKPSDRDQSNNMLADSTDQVIYNPQSPEKAANNLAKIHLEENLDWNDIENFLNHFENKRPTLVEGKNEIIDFLTRNYPAFDVALLQQMEIVKFQREFIDWVKAPLTNEKPGHQIQSLYFGLFTSTDPKLTNGNEEVKVLYVAGSAISPLEDPGDWAVEPDYFPKARYFVPDEFLSIENELKKYEGTSDVEQIIYNGLINLVVVNSKKELRKLIGDKTMHLGSGFDEGPTYYLGKM